MMKDALYNMLHNQVKFLICGKCLISFDESYLVRT